MSCKNVCKLCDHLVISQAVSFTGGNLVITLPAGSYNNGEKYCIVVAQSIPEATTINAPVVIQIGTGTTLYPLQKPKYLNDTISPYFRHDTKKSPDNTSGQL